MAGQTTAIAATSQRRFYTMASWTAAVIVVLGFAKTYYLKVLFGTPSLSPLFHIHGLVMSLWIVLFIVQTQLVASHKVALHKKLGMFGGLVALSVLVVGFLGAVTAARLGRSPGPPPLVFLVVPMGDLVVFATMVGFGLAYRARLDSHKRLMLLSCIGILGAAIARIPLEAIKQAGPLAFFGITDLLILMCIGYDRIKTKRFHPAFLWGGLFIFLSHPLRLVIGGSSAWMKAATWLVK
jgi:hypothetical protein